MPASKNTCLPGIIGCIEKFAATYILTLGSVRIVWPSSHSLVMHSQAKNACGLCIMTNQKYSQSCFTFLSSRDLARAVRWKRGSLL